jgi:hypothetical protein
VCFPFRNSLSKLGTTLVAVECMDPPGLCQALGMAKKRTKADRLQRRTEQLEKRLDRRPDEIEKTIREDVNEAAARTKNEDTKGR